MTKTFLSTLVLIGQCVSTIISYQSKHHQVNIIYVTIKEANEYFKGNCLELAANGILNQVYCNDTFEDGCPQDHYFSNEMYKCKYLFKNDKSV